jgi:DNA-binding LacI/PurR family transcriptional regulator
VPGDVSVVGFDDIPGSSHFWPPLTTVAQEFHLLGRECLRLVVELIDGESAPETQPIAPRIVVRDSTAPPR